MKAELGALWNSTRTRLTRRLAISLAVTALAWVADHAAGDVVFNAIIQGLVWLGHQSIGFFGLLFFILLAAVLLAALLEVRPRKELRPAEVGATNAAEVAELKVQIALLEKHTTEQGERIQFGEPLLEVPMLSDMDRTVLRAHVQEVMLSLDAMVGSAEQVWKGLSSELQEATPNTSLYWLKDQIRETVIKRAAMTYHVLHDYVKFGRDPRPLLFQFYKQYRGWRTWIARMAELLRRDLSTVPEYAVWQQNEAKFWEDFGKKLAISQFAVVRSAIREYDGEHGELPKLV